MADSIDPLGPASQSLALPANHPVAKTYPLAPPTLPVNYDTGPLAGQQVPGLLQQGNIDVNHRPSIKNADGSSSSIYSMTVPLDAQGNPLSWGHPNVTQYALVPSIANGRFLTPSGQMPAENDVRANQQLEDAATKYYAKTRQHLGIFKTADHANKYAGDTHDYGNDNTPRKVYTPSIKR